MYTHCQHTASTILFICATVIDICRDVVCYLVTFVVYLRTHLAGTANTPASQALQTHLPRRHCKHTCLAGNANTPAWQALQPSIDADTGTAAAADWKRPLGRPTRTWLQQVEEYYGLSVDLAQIASQNRTLWRLLRSSAGQSQQ